MDTLAYYDQHAQAFYDLTVDVDVQHLYRPFVAPLPPGAHILDAGCGSGRDSRHFLACGYRVTAMEPCEALAARAEALIAQPVVRRRFAEVDWAEAFDGIWASASLLHVPKAEIDDALGRLTRALRPGGALYASFKYGTGERVRKGRFFNFYDEAAFAAVLARHPALHLASHLRTEDVRTAFKGELWLNAYMIKR
ncbi:MAG: class I SAM-dependent methyltransferase [Candidatus Sericytochromatia bacterium]